MSSDLNRDHIRALARGLEVIEVFDRDHASMSLAEVAKRAGLSRATARRVLLTLQSMGYVDGTDGRFRLLPRVLRLGYAYLSSVRLWDLARPYLEDVRRETGQTCSIAVLDGSEIVFVARVAAARLVRDYIPLGFRWPAYPTALGRVLLSALSDREIDAYLAQTDIKPLTSHTVTDPAELRHLIHEVRDRGWAAADRDIDPNLRSVAVPVFDSHGRTIAAMNTNALAHVMTQEEIEKAFVPILKKAAAAFSEVVRWQTNDTEVESP